MWAREMMDDERGVMNGESSGTKLKVYSSVLPTQLMINWACQAEQYMLGFKDGRLRLGRAAVCFGVLKPYLRLSLRTSLAPSGFKSDFKADYHSWNTNEAKHTSLTVRHMYPSRHTVERSKKSFNALSLFLNSLQPSPEEADVPAPHFSRISLFILRRCSLLPTDGFLAPRVETIDLQNASTSVRN